MIMCLSNFEDKFHLDNTAVAFLVPKLRAVDWFERLTGFRDAAYDDTRAKLKVEGGRLQSLVNRKHYGAGTLELVSLQSLRER